MAGSPVLRFIKTKAFRISASVVVLLVALYAIAGFVVVPRILRSALMQDIPKTLGVTPAVGEIRFNPFLLELEVKDLSLAAPTGEKLLGFGRLFVDFELSSIDHQARETGFRQPSRVADGSRDPLRQQRLDAPASLYC